MIRAWNLMHGEIRWDAIETVAELVGVDDIERLLAGLHAIAEHHRAAADESRGVR